MERFLVEETLGEKKTSMAGNEVYLPVIDATISVEDNPIETMHLGWPKLGGSCLDIVEGAYQYKAAGYLLNPAVRVIYIRDKKNPQKPLARVSVWFDPASKTLVAISPIKASAPYGFMPLVRNLFKEWAKYSSITVVLPTSLGYNKNLGDNFVSDKRKVSLPKGLLRLYSDLTGEVNGWESLVEGWVFENKADVWNLTNVVTKELETMDKTILGLLKQNSWWKIRIAISGILRNIGKVNIGKIKHEKISDFMHKISKKYVDRAI
ncbi:MAG: hypothetical protein ABII74_04980 [Elusimicrobiota bacterium]